jgi:hypothetical protein
MEILSTLYGIRKSLGILLLLSYNNYRLERYYE